ncbi:MAG: carboxypeptidase-like regulatory domain-containing protein, partial [Mameliella sp.]|nr:carboxypeptidase-like regulatory domain-containing protein [Phaeodactylibacter sp.]
MKSPILLLLLLLATAPLMGQVTLRGQITDADTKEGIPFSNVYFEGTTTGTSTDVDGFYEFTVEVPGDSLSASAIGYAPVSKQVGDQAEQVINFSLGGSGLTLDEVVVIAGENPANAIVKGIIDRKPVNRMSARESYAFESYAKIELDLENIDEKLREKKLLKPFEFIFENIDSTSDEKPFLPIYINEILSDVLYVKDAGEPKRIIKAQRATGTNNQTVIEYIKRIHLEYSIYDDWIYVLDKPFASPFSKAGLNYYEYYIIDSAMVNGHWSHQLKFKPKRKQEPTFYGDFWVADSIFAVQRANMRMTPDANINLVSRIIIHEEYEPQGEDPKWVPVKKKMVVDFSPAENAPGMIARRTETFQKMRINQIGTKQDYIENEEFYLLDEVKIESDSFWQKARHEPLSKTEQQVYTMVDSIKNMPIFKTYIEVLETVFVGYLQVGKVEFGPYASLYSFNPVEGDRFRIGARTTRAFSEKIRLGGFLAYGLQDERFKYG